jgi:hypothetical protein
MKFFAVTLIVFLGLFTNHSEDKLSCNNFNGNNSAIDLCKYINKPISFFLSDIKAKVVDTIPSRQYTGNLTSIYFKLENGASYEVLPSLKYNEALYKQLRDNFNLSLIADSSIKCIKYIKKGEVVNECGCSKAL